MNNSTIQTYNKYSKEYDQEVVEFWENFTINTIKEFVKQLNGKRVLNLGSGTGRDSIILRDKGLEVICCDASIEMAKITRKLGFETIESDFNELNLDNNSFDGVWAYTSLLHVTKEEMIEVLGKINKALKPGGVFLNGMIEGKFEGDVERDNMPGAKRYFRYYEESELREIVEKVGFEYLFLERYQPHSKIYLAQIYKKS